MRLWGILGGLALLLAGASLALADEMAPDFSLPNLDGKAVRLSSLYAKGPVVVSFWATWCVPCPEEMKHLQRFYEKYSADSLTVLAIAIDGPKTVSKVKPFVMGRRITMPVLLDSNNDVKRLYRVTAVPTICIVERGGRIAYSHVGYRPGDEVNLEKKIQLAIAADSTRVPATPPSTSPKSSEKP
jgi:peroxiredoxin